MTGKSPSNQRERFEQTARDLGVDLDEEKLKEALREIAGSGRHFSDCAVHNGPAMTPGPCDCGITTER